jgi:hypothetical protein
LESLPLATPISFQIVIKSVSKQIKRSEYEAELLNGKNSFPPLPTGPTAVTLRIDKLIRIQGKTAIRELVLDGPNLTSQNCQFTVEEPRWLGLQPARGDDEIGRVKCSARLEGTLTFTGVPSFTTELLSCQVRILLLAWLHKLSKLRHNSNSTTFISEYLSQV